MRHLWIVAVLGLLVPAAWGAKVEVKGKVVDADDKPVAGVSVGTFWKLDKGELVPGTYYGLKPLVTNEKGEFSGTLYVYSGKKRATPMLAIDGDGKRGGFAKYEDPGATGPFTIKLGKLVDVKGKLKCDALAKKPTPSYFNTQLAGSGYTMLQSCRSEDWTFAFRLPPGKYKLNLAGQYLKRKYMPLEITADSKDVDLGEVAMQPTVIGRNIGKPALPLTVTDARGAEKTISIADYKGKWLMIEFWGYW